MFANRIAAFLREQRTTALKIAVAIFFGRFPITATALGCLARRVHGQFGHFQVLRQLVDLWFQMHIQLKTPLDSNKHACAYLFLSQLNAMQVVLPRGLLCGRLWSKLGTGRRSIRRAVCLGVMRWSGFILDRGVLAVIMVGRHFAVGVCVPNSTAHKSTFEL